MIITGALNAVISLLGMLFAFLPSLPALPSSITSVLDLFVSMLGNGLAIMGNWFNMPVLIGCLALAVPVAKFKDVWGFIRFFINKIPFINIRM